MMLCDDNEEHGAHGWADIDGQVWECYGVTAATAAMAKTPQHAMLLTIREQAWDHFWEAYTEHGPGFADELGLAAQWMDLNRKVKKLKPTMWQGVDNLTRESAETVLEDLIGHAYLALDMLRRGMKGGPQ